MSRKMEMKVCRRTKKSGDYRLWFVFTTRQPELFKKGSILHWIATDGQEHAAEIEEVVLDCRAKGDVSAEVESIQLWVAGQLAKKDRQRDEKA